MVDGDAYAILTDIQGPEDEFGDMDLKVAGTVNGITAVQMDVKVVGIPIVILREALEQARQARLQILDTMRAELTGPRPAISARAPHITTLTINPEQIGLVIGSGGKTINRLKEQYEVDEITIEDSGQIFITGPAGKGELAKTAITAMTKTYQIGDTATVEITKLTNFGAFARLDPYHEGLIHVSEIAPFHIEDPADVLTEGEIVNVVVSRVDGEKIGLSIKEIDSAFATRKGITPPTPVKN